MNLASTLLWAILATTAGSLEQARTLYEAGGRAYRAGRYDIAIDAFESARRISERDVVVFALAQSYRLRYFKGGALGDLEAAVAAYRRYLELVPEGERAFHAARHLAAIEPFLDRRRIEMVSEEAPPPRARFIVASDVEDAIARIDDGPAQPVPATFEVEPGPHVIQVEAPGHQPLRHETMAVEDSAVAVILQPPPIPGRVVVRALLDSDVTIDGDPITAGAPIDLPPGPHVLIARAHGHRALRQPFEVRSGDAFDLTVDLEPTTQRLFAWGVLGTSGLLAAAGLTTGLLALDAQSDAEALEAGLGAGLTGEQFDEHDRLRARRDELGTATLAIGVAAGVALTSGVLLWVFDAADQPAGLEADTPAVR